MQKVIKKDKISDIITTMLECIGDASVQEYGCHVLSNLACNEENKIISQARVAFR